MSDKLTVTDSRTGDTVELELDDHAAFNGSELRKLGVRSYDQPLLATATARSALTYLDGDAGILRYRGYPIEQLAERCAFLEVAYLLARGELPSPDELTDVPERGVRGGRRARRDPAFPRLLRHRRAPDGDPHLRLRGARRPSPGGEARPRRRDASRALSARARPDGRARRRRDREARGRRARHALGRALRRAVPARVRRRAAALPGRGRARGSSRTRSTCSSSSTPTTS